MTTRKAYHRSYYSQNKEQRKEDIRYKRELRDPKIHKSILIYDGEFFKRKKPQRRSLIHNILLGEYAVEVPFFTTTYEQFVKLYNDRYNELKPNEEFINQDGYIKPNMRRKPKEHIENFVIESKHYTSEEEDSTIDSEDEGNYTEYTIQSDTESVDIKGERLRSLRERLRQYN